MRIRHLLAAVLCSACFLAPAQAMWIMPSDCPVDRVIANLERQLKDKPQDAHLHYLLGRTHYLAWAGKSGLVPVYNLREVKKGELPNLGAFGPSEAYDRAVERQAEKSARQEMGIKPRAEVPANRRDEFVDKRKRQEEKLRADHWVPPEIKLDSQLELDRHARAAMSHFHEALKADPRNGLFRLGLASCMQDVADRAAQLGWLPDGGKEEKPDPAKAQERRHAWLLATFREYGLALEDSKAEIEKMQQRQLCSPVSIEVAWKITALAPSLALSAEEDTKIVALAQDHQAKYNKLPPGPITPILFSASGRAAHLAELMVPQRQVAFDLDGDGEKESRPWLSPDAVLVGWDPAGTGKIASGRNLAGSVTWWMFWKDGYEALSALDDDGDGWLRGKELDGLVGWRDANGDGVCDPGEVRPLADYGVVGLRCAADGTEAPSPGALASPKHSAGILRQDGVTTPSWDWVAP